MKWIIVLMIAFAASLVTPGSSEACTGISLKSLDGAVIAARTVEWALGDANHDTLVVFPRGHAFTALAPEGENGLKWEGL
jgi:choloylglycine hydrolase